ncbi:hypothetical protein H8E88_14960 [candidate division KSB1 bacterium]|nr:hypothetical protein [candidate division KSB1 bacterium]
MKRLFSINNIPATIIFLCLILIVILVFIPPEKNLGHVIKAVFIHAAMIRCGLLILGAAGVIAVLDLVKHSQRNFLLCLSTQYTALTLWIIYMVSSVIVTYLAWGIPIAWNEPRTQVSFVILFVLLAGFLISKWFNQRIVTDLINIFLTLFSWIAVKNAINISHPFDPIGRSELMFYKVSYLLILFVFILFSIQIIRWFYKKFNLNES